MQSERTLRFWDEYYAATTTAACSTTSEKTVQLSWGTNNHVALTGCSNNDSTTTRTSSSSAPTTHDVTQQQQLKPRAQQEWILEPSDALFQQIASAFRGWPLQIASFCPSSITVTAGDHDDVAVTSPADDGGLTNVVDEQLDDQNNTGNDNKTKKKITIQYDTIDEQGDEDMYRIVEIGCGTSILAREFWMYLHKENDKNEENKESLLQSKTSTNSNNELVGPLESIHKNTVGRRRCEFYATDVSNVCIEQIKQRDMTWLQSPLFDGFHYEVLNIAIPFQDSMPNNSPLESSHQQQQEGQQQQQSILLQKKWDVVLDKGCLDTFLFRSRQRGPWRAYAGPIRTVLDNIHKALRNTESSVYLIVSTRPKIKAIRDYAGFRRVERRILTLTTTTKPTLDTTKEAKSVASSSMVDGFAPGDTVERRAQRIQTDKKKSKDEVYLYVCYKNCNYQPFAVGIDDGRIPFVSTHLPINLTYSHFDDNSTCPKCQLTFFDFRHGETLLGRGEVFWYREWTGHCIHCKEIKEASRR